MQGSYIYGTIGARLSLLPKSGRKTPNQNKLQYIFRFSETSRTYQCLMLLDTLLLNESYANGGNAIPS
jgi:hypothetical protein